MVCRSHLHCPRQFLDWNFRKQRILQELDGYNADIMCLQEVERDVFFKEMEPMYAANGFEGLYCRKAPVIPQGFEEGVATFFRTSIFERIASQSDRFTNQFQKAGTGIVCISSSVLSSLCKLIHVQLICMKVKRVQQ